MDEALDHNGPVARPKVFRDSRNEGDQTDEENGPTAEDSDTVLSSVAHVQSGD